MQILEKSPHLAELKLSYKTSKKRTPLPYKIVTSKEAYDLLQHLFDQDTLELREEFIIVFLNACKYSLGWCRFAIGSKSSVQIDLAHIVSMALLANAHSVLLAHNHPSGNLSASQPDKNLTKVLLNALHLHGIELLDHLIVTTHGYKSLRDMIDFNPVNIHNL